MSGIVYRILDAEGTPCNAKGFPDDMAVYTNPASVDRSIRQLNDPNYAPRSPQPKGRPFRRETGQILWEGSPR